MNHDGEQRHQYDQDEQSRRHDHCVTFRLPSHPRSVGRAREILHRDFGFPGEQGDTAALLLSELVTNALRHGSPPGREVAVTLHHGEGLFRLEVEDAGDYLPRPRIPDLDDECGRGLALVAALADDWGVAPRRGPGKRVWVMLKVADPVGPSGSVGPSGPSGPSGPAGSVGPSGLAGPAGSVGPSGLAGPAGSVGPSGLAGPAGSVGAGGSVGRADRTGPAGPGCRTHLPERPEPPDLLDRASQPGR
ncbi:ATP-binding protein [Streptomyces corynorhini]|uniref:ATP-binding protein n=1 Tax=Streptomyces corynorhini TaxID=2282652 RepID=A0A370B2S8_9ACTN|nr:ATP-binding protein [Streptomyces corynorhini]